MLRTPASVAEWVKCVHAEMKRKMFALNKDIKKIATKTYDALTTNAETITSVALLMSNVETWIIENSYLKDQNRLKRLSVNIGVSSALQQFIV